MGSTYTITTSDDEDNAIAHVAGDPSVDKQVYLEACVHGQLLQPWVRQYWIATSPVPPVDVATGYVTATPDQQQQINDILGLTPTPPPDGGGGTPPPPTVTTFNYQWQRTSPPPSQGQVRTEPSGTDWTTSTVLGLADIAADSVDATSILTQIVMGATIHIADAGSDSLDLAVSGLGTDTGTAWSYPVSVTGSTGSTPANGTAVTVQITIPAPPSTRVVAGQPERALTF